MNTPTPLGKTYEQYEKEVKEYKEINLSKVERVELGSEKEIQAQIKSLNKIYGEIQKSQQKFIKDIAELDKEAEEQRRINEMGEKAVDRAYNTYNDFEAAAKSLGVNPNDSKPFKDLDQTIGSVVTIVERGYKILKGRK